MSNTAPTRATDGAPVLALTPGEPAGIGPDLCIALVQEPPAADLVVIADGAMLRERARLLGRELRLPPWPGRPAATPRLYLHDVPAPRRVTAGRLDPANAHYVLDTLRIAADGCLRGEFDGLVTGPVHKGTINDAGIAFTGHTEFLAGLGGARQPVMMLACPGLRVALATIHLPLAEVSGHITRERLTAVLEVLDHDLRARFGIPAPVILVCGLNPHAGESGHLGREEIEVITPVIEALCARGLKLRGPVPADTAFIPAQLAGVDAVLAMYHDQGLPVIKHHDFAHAVNVTLGLPFVRTSVDHGTALELAGTGRADASSLRAAIALAAVLARGGRTA
jgi:4-hydroxythreonine-4-phosphate dehydrogenase